MSYAIPKDQPKSSSQLAVLAECGFRFCNKDDRYESRRKLSPAELENCRRWALFPYQYGKGSK